jgi:hypothetical protein
MTLLAHLDAADLATLVAVISHSQIVVAEEAVESGRSLPDGFDDVDVTILDWIAADGRRARQGLVYM